MKESAGEKVATGETYGRQKKSIGKICWLSLRNPKQMERQLLSLIATRHQILIRPFCFAR
jgi:hypothetical protein